MASPEQLEKSLRRIKELKTRYALCKLLVRGLSNKEMAEDLQVSTTTVKSHLNRLFFTYDINDGIKRVKLATYLYRNKDKWLKEGDDL